MWNCHIVNAYTVMNSCRDACNCCAVKHQTRSDKGDAAVFSLNLSLKTIQDIVSTRAGVDSTP